MECKYHKNIEAYHDRLLDPHATEELSVHLQKCSDCQSYLKRLEFGDQLITKLKSLRPQLENPGDFRNEILLNIKSRKQPDIWKALMRTVDALLFFLVQPATRYTFVTAALIFFGLFVYQQAGIVQKIDSLEKRLESKVNDEESGAKDRKAFEAFLKRGAEEQHRGKDFDALLKDFSQLQLRHKVLMKILQEKYPEIYKELAEEMDEELSKDQNVKI